VVRTRGRDTRLKPIALASTIALSFRDPLFESVLAARDLASEAQGNVLRSFSEHLLESLQLKAVWLLLTN
jgi:hypothetical protein